MDEKSDTSGAAPRRPSSSSPSHPMPASQVELALVDLEHNAPLKFPSNEIKTSKYNLITFLPLTLMEQFRRVSNVYFALVAAIGFIPGASPFTPLSNAMPLVFVIAVAMVKAAYEDIQRHRSDYKANSVHATVFRDGAWIEVPSFKVQVGDLLLIRNGEEVRADCCLLYSSDHEGIGYIDTASLDGESSLKTKRCRPFTQHFFHHADLAQRLQAAEDTRFMMIVDTPCANLESWKGIIEQRDAATNEVLCSSPATIHQFLPRGSNVRNVDLVIGGVVYTGVDTKLFLNLKHSLSKMSHLDRVVNKFIAGVFVVNQLLIIGLCAGAVVWTNSVANSGLWYAQPYLSKFTNGGGAYVFFWQYLGFFALMSFMIPISLFVSLELVKVTQALFMAWDPRMTYIDAKTGETKYCRPKTSDLNDQLAQVKYIFTDKTGTLTENKMNFLQLVSGNRMHNETVQPGALRQMLEGDTDRDFFTNRLHGLAFAMSTCHSVLAFTKESEEGGRLYDGTSPDEVALVRTASRNGYVLTSRNSQQVVVDILGTPMTVDVLAELEFSAERKRMSVLVQLPDKRIVLLTKGADSAILPLSDMTDPASQQMRENVEQELETMSLQGLRTLVFGFRFIEKEKAEKWLTVFEEASRSMGQRVAALHDAYDQIEFGFMLFGATGVEDKLQDGVEDTIRFFIDAGVTIWMLTGDKRETAVTIASTSGLWRPDNIAHHLDVTQEYDPHSDPDEMWKFLGPDIERTHASLLADPGTQFLVIDGLTLSIFLRYDPDRFAAMGALCMGAVCCRLTPMQKADCVRLFQTRSGKTVLAVGDGANDVSMIQQARVGIGIMGLEGSQAELSSDYAIPRFKHLRHLLALHGRFSWYRNTTKILYCFYKSIQLSLVLFVFTFWSGYSVQTFFDSWMISLYNTFFTIWFPLSIGMFDKDVEDEVALHRPQLYAIVRDEQMHFNSRSFLNWGIEMALHGAMTYGLGYLYATQDDFDTHSASITHVSTAAFIQLLAAVCATAMLTIQRWDAIQVGAATATILSIPGFIFAYSALDILESTTEVAGIATEVFATPIVYFGTVIILLVFLLGTVARKYISKTEIPTATDAIVAEWHRAKARLARGPRSDRRR